MKHSVLLVQRGISSQVHPISGKSLKQYGIATQSPARGGVVFEMSLDDYMAAAHDLIGNTMAGQQWVPEFVPASSPNGAVEKCGIPLGCRFGVGGKAADATYVWERFFFCSGHAPNNATALIPNAPPIGTMPETAEPQPAEVQDVQPRIVERGVGPQVQEKGGDSPPEQIQPFVGTAAEEGPASNDAVNGVQRPESIELPKPTKTIFRDPNEGPAIEVRVTPFVDPGQAPTKPVETATATPLRCKPEYQEALRVTATEAAQENRPPRTVKPASEVIGEMIDKAIDTQLTAFKEELMRLITPAAQPAKAPKKVKRTEPTEFEVLRGKAAAMGINTFAKGKVALEAEIAAKENPPRPYPTEDIFAPTATVET